MNLTWNLQDLFKNKEDFDSEISKVEKQLHDIIRYETEELNETKLYDMLNEQWALKEQVNRILVYGSLTYYKNIKSKPCIEMKATAEKLNNQVNAKLSFIDRKIIALGKETIHKFIAKNKKLEVYTLSLHNLFRLQEHIPNNTATTELKKNNDYMNLQLDLYNNILSEIKYGEIKVNGKVTEITPSNYVKYLASRDRETRKQAYLSMNQKFKDSEKTFSNILDSIVGARLKNAKLETYGSVLEKTLFEENIDPTIINSLIQAVTNNLVLMQKYLKIKSDLLNIPNPHLYDFGVPIDNNLHLKYTQEEAIEIIKKALKPLGVEYLKVVDTLLNGYLDAEPNDNKHQSITFSWNTYAFMNYRGSYVDLKNMIHELGHIVNYYLSQKNLPFIYEDSTIFVGETASIINELLLNRYLYEHATCEDERIFYLSKEIENYISSIFKQTMYTEFETNLYHIKSKTNLTPAIVSKEYQKLLQKYYGTNIIYDELSSVEWMRLGHLYKWSYYPYKYATGLIIASIVVDSIINKQSLSKEKYITFLSSGSSQHSLDLLKSINIDLTNTCIIGNGFKIMEQSIEKLNKILCEKISKSKN